MRGYGEYQDKKKKEAKYAILNVLTRSEMGMSFRELQRTTKLSSRTLSKRLKELQSENSIEKIKTSVLENLDLPEVRAEVMRQLKELLKDFKKEDFLTERVKKIRDPRVRRRIDDIYLKDTIDITKKPEHLQSFMKWLKGFYKHTKTPKKVRQFIKSLSKPKTVYRLTRPKAICKGEETTT